MVFAQAADFIRSHSRFLLTSHVNPDGDAIGAVMGLQWALSKLGKEGVIILDGKPPEVFNFLEGYSRVRSLASAGSTELFSTAIFADSPTVERVGAASGLLAPGAAILNLDHHISNENFGQVNLTPFEMSSSAEVVYRLIMELGLAPDRACAEYLYTGIIIDTGRFRFSNTAPETLRVAADLVAAGARPDKISEALYERNTYQTTRALGKFIDSVEMHYNGKVAVGGFDHGFIMSDFYKQVETEGFVNHALAIKGVEVAGFLREVEPGKTRGSLRSRSSFDVNELASAFGGGGHAKAAGCTIMAPLAQAREKLLAEIGKRLE